MSGHVLIDPAPWLDEIETRCRQIAGQQKPVVALIDALAPEISRLRDLAGSTALADREAIEASLNIAAASVALVFTVAAAAQWASPYTDDHHNATRH
ncbi:hypothetical protein [Asaia bogorensis]|uniref:hypothetical protein n=1 Tax=Asaia bogorensis TaxID=91915 RepID=UPI0013CEF82E|nr:hypothetical protein [Asaia bogorensis]